MSRTILVSVVRVLTGSATSCVSDTAQSPVCYLSCGKCKKSLQRRRSEAADGVTPCVHCGFQSPLVYRLRLRLTLAFQDQLLSGKLLSWHICWNVLITELVAVCTTVAAFGTCLEGIVGCTASTLAICIEVWQCVDQT